MHLRKVNFMNYNEMELQTLNLLKRADFKNLSKDEIVSFVSNLGEMRPEVAKDIISQFPELANFMKTTLTEYKGLLENIVKSDDSSIKEYYDTNKKGMNGASDSRVYYKGLAEKVLSDCNELLKNPNISSEEALNIIMQEREILCMVSKHDQQVFEQEKYYECKADKKDSEKRQFDTKLIEVATKAILGVAGLTLIYLTGGYVRFKVPNKN